MQPRVSFMTSLFKPAGFLDGLLSNVTEQTVFDQCEWIIIHPYGKDSEEEKILQPYVEAFSNIKYFQCEYDPGVYSIWNECVRQSSGEFLTNWNTDDRRYPDSTEKQLAMFEENPDVDLLYNDEYFHSTPNWLPWHTTRIGGNNVRHKLNWRNRPKPHYSLEALKSMNLPHNDPIWRKSLHERYGFFREDTITVADHEFWLRCALEGATFAKTESVFGIYYTNPNGISTSGKNRRAILMEKRRVLGELYEQYGH